jgi:hypothetical protein
MRNPVSSISRNLQRLMLFVLIFTAASSRLSAHPMPNSVVLLDVQPGGVTAELQLPLNELELAFGHDVNKNPQYLLKHLSPELKAYIQSHIHPVGKEGKAWTVQVGELIVQKVPASASGPYYELRVQVILNPPAGESTRDFTLMYDVILHQVATHFALVSVRQDWEAGLYGEKAVEIGVIAWDIRSNTIPVFKVNLAGGGVMSGFMQTVKLGMHHIAEGTDHLLFLLVLLLPAPLFAGRRRWGQFGGWRYSWIRLLRIVTSFTIGHSITLIAGSIGLFTFPSQLVEIVIAFSIIISAAHAFWPLFSGKEIYVAAGFGLVHGMAFAGTLLDLKLDFYHLGLSILGFNLGIELMQLLVIAVVFPWLMILSRTNLYSPVRIGGALLSAVAAIGWIIERITAKPNVITITINDVAGHALSILVTLAVMAILSLFTDRGRTQLG